ncbi:MAG: Type 1 glutamine amidotransferase-like domain-containing protein, partial [bacterium]
YDIVMVEGGNTFYLLRAVRESGFENVVKDLIAKGVVYIGSSAGSYIACPSIVMSTFREHSFGNFGVTDLTAMNLVPFLIKAHHTPDMLPKLKEIRKNLECPLYVLTDEQALLVRNKKVEMIGGGDEIVL